MSQKSKKKRAAAVAKAPAPPPRRARRYIITAALVAACALLTAGYAATRYEPLRRAVGLGPLPAPAAQQGSLPLAKEYVYAGGRLVATEEPPPVTAPTPATIGPPPTGFAAAFAAASSGAGGVMLTWTRPPGDITGYVVERRQGVGASDPVTSIPVGGNVDTFIDSPGAVDVAYLYRVRAVFAGGGSSPYSAYDLATTVAFTDESLQGAVIRADHLKELRRAVRAARVLAGKGEPTWSHPAPVSSPASARRAIYLADVTELRSQLDEALTALDQALGVQTFFKPYPAEPALAQHAPVYAAHFEQLRDRVK